MRTVKPFDILLPTTKTPEKWAVVSCDQFTSQRGYWNELDSFVGDSDSTLRLIFPEVYLEDKNPEKRIGDINAEMLNYIDKGAFCELKDCFVLIKRDTAFGAHRLGLVLCVDLEDYSFDFNNPTPIRSTEGVVHDRIPPRLAIRKDAAIELPHIILLADDANKLIIEPLYERREEWEKLYDFDLNMNGGHLTGYAVPVKEAVKNIEKYEEYASAKFGTPEFLYAVGDGNHSLATAQAHWNAVKQSLTEDEKKNHPARYALCELENLHSDGVTFEPIHRFVFNAEAAEIIAALSHMEGDGEISLYADGVRYTLHAPENGAKAIADVQAVLDKFVSENPECKIDYIHGAEHLYAVADGSRGVAIEMPKIEKTDLFEYVCRFGNLCRKAFSMGEAEEKRYYYEAKRIK